MTVHVSGYFSVVPLTQNPRIKDNLQIGDKGSCTNLSVIVRFHCSTYMIIHIMLCIPEEGKLLPRHKRVGHQTLKLGSHQAQAGQGKGQVVAGLDSTVAEAGLDRVPGLDKQLVELKRTMFPAV